MKNLYREITLPASLESPMERQSLLRILRRLEGDQSAHKREKSPLTELRRAVEWNLMGRPVVDSRPSN